MPGWQPSSAAGTRRAIHGAAPLAAVAALLCCTNVQAFDPTLGSAAATAMASSTRPTLSLRHDSLLDTVEHAPNSDGGGFEDARSRQRFAATRLALSLPGSGRGSASLTLGSYRLVTLRDDLDVLGVRTDAGWRLSALSSPQQWRLLVSLSSNRASEFDKNSYTQVEGATLTRTRIASPSDLQGSIGLGVARRADNGLRIDGFARFGAARVRHSEVTGTGQDNDGCRYDVQASADGARIQLAEPCGRVQSFTEIHPSEQGLSDRYGIAPSKDLDWQAAWVETGVSTGWSGSRFDASLGYRFRQYRRDGIDERIEASGERARRASHVLSLQAGWRFSPRVSLSAGIDYRIAPWLDDLPILYNRFTAQRQDKQLPSFRLTLLTRFGR